MEGSRDRGQPPRDPETWTDEQWLAWLEATDEDPPGKASTDSKRTRRRPTGGLGAAMLGLRDALYGRVDDDVVIVADGGGDPPADDAPLVHLDPEHPERSEVVVGRRRRPAAPP